MWLKYLEHGRRITPMRRTCAGPPAFSCSPRPKAMRPARMEAYRKSDADFYSDASLCFNVIAGGYAPLL